MPSKGRKFISEFLLPSLNQEIFGSRLMWLDIERKVFQIQWNHKSASDWTTNDAAVFAAWDKRKGHYNPNEREYYSKSKQRFRAALYKFIKYKHITEIYSKDKYTKIYCIGDGTNLSGTYVTVVRNEKENERKGNSQMIVKENPEDLFMDWDFIWNADLLTKSQESCLVSYDPKAQKVPFVKEEKILTNCADEDIQDKQYYENLGIYVPSVNSSTDNWKNVSVREITNNMNISEDVESLYIEFHFLPETTISTKDKNFKPLSDIECINFHDYLCTVKDTLKQVKCPDLEFELSDEDPSFELPLPCINC